MEKADNVFLGHAEEAASLTPEERMWKAVLVVAIRDIAAGGQLRDNVKRWAMRRGKDEGFRFCCWNAGVDPDVVRESFRKLITDTGDSPDPTPIRESILSQRQFHVAHLGVPAHEVVQAIQELQEEGFNIVRAGGGLFQHVPLEPRVKADVSNQNRLKTDARILSGQPFIISPGDYYCRSRIDALRRRGFDVAWLGPSMFRCKNPPEKSIASP
jgi:hypothetical protein